MLSRVLNVYRHNDIKTYNDRIYTINKDLIVYNIGYKVCGTMIYTRPTNTVNNVQQADRGISVITEGVSKLIHPLFILPLPCLPHNSLFTVAMLLISYKMIYWALNSLYKLV